MDPQQLGLLLIVLGVIDFPILVMVGMRRPPAQRGILLLAAACSSLVMVSLGVLFMLGKLGNYA